MADDDPDFTPKEKFVHDTKTPTQVAVPTGDNPDGPTGLGAEWKNWRVVKKAIKGYHDMSGDVAQNWLDSNGGGWAQPQTAFDMGDAFSTLAETMLYVRDALVTHTNKLFETWEGPAAKAYGEVINAASEMLRAQYNSIVAPPGGQNMQDLLYHVGNTLLWGQNQITYVEDAFAKAAQASGATVVTTEGGGRLTHISEVPELVEAKNEYFFQIASTVNNGFAGDRGLMGTPPPASAFTADTSGLNFADPNALTTDSLQDALNNAFPDLNESLSAPGLTDAEGNPLSVPSPSLDAPPGLDTGGVPSLGLADAPTAPDGLGATPAGLDPNAFDPATGEALQVPSPSLAPPPELTGSGAPGGVPGLLPGGVPGLTPGGVPGLAPGGVPSALRGSGLPGSLPLGTPGASASRAQQDGGAARPVEVPQIDIGEPPAIGAPPGAPGIPALQTGSLADAPSVGMDGAGNRIEVPQLGLDGAPVGGISPDGTSLGIDGVSSPGSTGSVGSLGTPGSVGSLGSNGLGSNGFGSNGLVAPDGSAGTGSAMGSGSTSNAAGDGVIPGGTTGSAAMGGGMPMYPPMMGGMGAGAGERRNDESNTWLQEHREPWDKGDGAHVVGVSLGREGVAQEKERQRHHLRMHQEAFQHHTADRVTTSATSATAAERKEQQQEAVHQG